MLVGAFTKYCENYHKISLTTLLLLHAGIVRNKLGSLITNKIGYPQIQDAEEGRWDYLMMDHNYDGQTLINSISSPASFATKIR